MQQKTTFRDDLTITLRCVLKSHDLQTHTAEKTQEAGALRKAEFPPLKCHELNESKEERSVNGMVTLGKTRSILEESLSVNGHACDAIQNCDDVES